MVSYGKAKARAFLELWNRRVIPLATIEKFPCSVDSLRVSAAYGLGEVDAQYETRRSV